MHKQYTLHQWPPLPIHTHRTENKRLSGVRKMCFPASKCWVIITRHCEQQTDIKRGIFSQHHLFIISSQALQLPTLSIRCRCTTAPGASSIPPPTPAPSNLWPGLSGFVIATGQSERRWAGLHCYYRYSKKFAPTCRCCTYESPR